MADVFFRYKQDEFSVSFPPVGKRYTDFENTGDVVRSMINITVNKIVQIWSKVAH